MLYLDTLLNADLNIHALCRLHVAHTGAQRSALVLSLNTALAANTENVASLNAQLQKLYQHHLSIDQINTTDANPQWLASLFFVKHDAKLLPYFSTLPAAQPSDDTAASTDKRQHDADTIDSQELKKEEQDALQAHYMALFFEPEVKNLKSWHTFGLQEMMDDNHADWPRIAQSHIDSITSWVRTEEVHQLYGRLARFQRVLSPKEAASGRRITITIPSKPEDAAVPASVTTAEKELFCRIVATPPTELNAILALNEKTRDSDAVTAALACHQLTAIQNYCQQEHSANQERITKVISALTDPHFSELRHYAGDLNDVFDHLHQAHLLDTHFDQLKQLLKTIRDHHQRKKSDAVPLTSKTLITSIRLLRLYSELRIWPAEESHKIMPAADISALIKHVARCSTKGDAGGYHVNKWPNSMAETRYPSADIFNDGNIALHTQISPKQATGTFKRYFISHLQRPNGKSVSTYGPSLSYHPLNRSPGFTAEKRAQARRLKIR